MIKTKNSILNYDLYWDLCVLYNELTKHAKESIPEVENFVEYIAMDAIIYVVLYKVDLKNERERKDIFDMLMINARRCKFGNLMDVPKCKIIDEIINSRELSPDELEPLKDSEREIFRLFYMGYFPANTDTDTESKYKKAIEVLATVYVTANLIAQAAKQEPALIGE